MIVTVIKQNRILNQITTLIYFQKITVKGSPEHNELIINLITTAFVRFTKLNSLKISIIHIYAHIQ